MQKNHVHSFLQSLCSGKISLFLMRCEIKHSSISIGYQIVSVNGDVSKEKVLNGKYRLLLYEPRYERDKIGTFKESFEY